MDDGFATRGTAEKRRKESKKRLRAVVSLCRKKWSDHAGGVVYFKYMLVPTGVLVKAVCTGGKGGEKEVDAWSCTTAPGAQELGRDLLTGAPPWSLKGLKSLDQPRIQE